MKRILAYITLIAASSATTLRAQELQHPIVSAPDLYRALVGAKIGSKGVDEKTSSYEERVSRFRFKGRGVHDEYMVVFKPSMLDRFCYAEFNADVDEISFTCRLRRANDVFDGLSFPIRQSRTSSSYVGANAFNRKVNVIRESYNLDVLLLNASDDGAIRGVKNFSSNPIKSRAGRLKSDYQTIEVGVVFKLRPPYTEELIDFVEPTVSSPYEIVTRANAVVGTVLRLHLFMNGGREPLRTYGVRSFPVDEANRSTGVYFPEVPR